MSDEEDETVGIPCRLKAAVELNYSSNTASNRVWLDEV